MRTTSVLAAALLIPAALPAMAQPAPEHKPICLNIRNVQDASSTDGKIMTFRMKDGTIYRNHLRQTCDSLIFGGFAWTINPSQEICEDMQTLRTLTVGEICRLGKFDPPTRQTATR